MRACLLALVLVSGCLGDDPRFATPEATVQAMLGSYGLEAVSEADVRARLASRAPFTLRDEATFRAVFVDHRGPHDDGAAAYVLGRIAAAKDHLAYHTVGDGDVRVSVRGETSALALLVRTDDGYRVELARSVPRDVRAQLREVYRRRSEALARAGVRG